MGRKLNTYRWYRKVLSVEHTVSDMLRVAPFLIFVFLFAVADAEPSNSIAMKPGFRSFLFSEKPTTKYFLVHFLDTMKRIELHSPYGTDIYLFDKKFPDSSAVDYSSRWYSGFLKAVTDSLIEVEVWQENSEIMYCNGNDEPGYMDYFMSEHVKKNPDL